MASRVTPRQAGVVVLAFVLGGVAAVVAEKLVRDTGTNPSSETVALATQTITTGSTDPLAVEAQVLRLPEGYDQRLTPAGGTLTLVETGRVEVEDASGRRTYVGGTSFFSPADEPYVLRVLADSRLSVVRLTSAR
jgi:hypothetical protein